MNTRIISVAALLLTLNLVLGKLATSLNLPVYLDCVGTILAAALLPAGYAIAVGVGTSLVAGLVINPYFPPYAPVQLTIALVALFLVRSGFFRRWWTALLGGLIIGLCALVVAAPITTLLFGGITLSGTTAINAVFIASGQKIMTSVLAGSFFVETIDKPSAALLAFLVLRRLPSFLQFKPAAKPADGEKPVA